MKRITLRLPDDLHETLQSLAMDENRSLNAQIIHLLRQVQATQADHEPSIVTVAAKNHRHREL